MADEFINKTMCNTDNPINQFEIWTMCFFNLDFEKWTVCLETVEGDIALNPT
jgi:hypothetical protein